MREFEYKALSIENISHSLNIPDTPTDLKGKLVGKNHYKASYAEDTNTVAIDVRSEVFYRETTLDEPQEKLFHIEVRNVFFVPELKEFLTDDGKSIEPKVLDRLLELAIAQARGVQSTIISGTPIAGTLIQR